MIIFDTPLKELASVRKGRMYYYILGITLKKIPPSRIPYEYYVRQEERHTANKRKYYLTLLVGKKTWRMKFIPVLVPEDKAPKEGEKVHMKDETYMYVSYTPPVDEYDEEIVSVRNHIPGTKFIYLVEEYMWKKMKGEKND